MKSIYMASNLTSTKRRILFKILTADKERKPVLRIIKELIQLWIIQRGFPSHYFGRHLYKKDRTNIHDYLPNKLLWSLWSRFNDKEAAGVLSNKLYYNLYFSQFNISLPRILMYNHMNRFVIGNRDLKINTLHEFKEILDDLIINHSEHKSVFIKKTYGSYGGSCTYRVSADQLPLDHEMIAGMYNEIMGSGYLFQETIQQHPQLNLINPSCVNTIRFDTFIDRNGEVDIMSAFLRMSSNNLHVDNGSAGGCFTGIDLKTGRLKKYGYTSFTRAGGMVLTAHPVTKVVFKDFAIPFFEEAKKLVIQVAGLMPNLRMIGWDVGITLSGPVIIEGNCGYDLTVNDLSYGGYRNNPVFKKVMEEIGYS